MTSKKTQMTDISQSPVWSNLFDSFMDVRSLPYLSPSSHLLLCLLQSIDWTSNRYHFGFYLGFDKADELYDTGDAWSEMRDMFRKRAEYRLKDQLVEPR
jgi:hypothetical protein